MYLEEEDSWGKMEIDLNQDIKLRRMALIELASSFWNRPQVENKIKNYFCLDRHKKEKMKNLRAELEKEIIDQIDKKSLPSEVLYAELVDIVITLGLKIFDWHRFVKRKHFFRGLDREKLYELYAKNIYWTHNGCVNHYQIVASWLTNPDVDLLNVYKMSCLFCFEDIIRKLWVKVSKYFESEEDTQKLFERHGSHFVAYWNCVQKNDFQNFVNNIKKLDANFYFYDQLSSAEECMFFLSIFKKNFLALKYFFGKMTQTEKTINLAEGYVEFSTLYRKTKNCVLQYREEQMIMMAIFLTSHLTYEMKESLWEGENVYKKESSLVFFLLEIFAINWPFIEHFGMVLKEFGRYLKPKEYNTILQNVAREMEYRYKISGTVENSVWKKIFFLLYSKMPTEAKFEIDVDEITKRFLAINDLRSINWFLNDMRTISTEKFSTEKFFMIECKFSHLTSIFNSIVEKNDKESLLKFIDEVLIPNKFEKTVRDKIKSLYDLLLQIDVDSAENLLKNCPEDEKKILRSGFSLYYMRFYYVLKYDLHSAADFYPIFFDNNRQGEGFAVTFLNQFIPDFTIILWKSFRENLDDAKEYMDDLVHWFALFSPDIEKTMRDLLQSAIRKDWIKIQNEFFFESDEFELLEEIRKYFDLPETVLSEEIVNQKFEQLMKKNQKDTARKLLEFRFDTEEDRKSFIQNFVSIKGVECCKFFIGKYCNTDDSQEEEFKKFIDFFIKPIENVESLKSELENWPKTYKEKFDKILNYDSSWDGWDDVYKSESFSTLPDDDVESYYDEQSNTMFLNLLNQSML